MPNPDPSLVLHLIEDFRRSKAMFAATSLGLFDRLHANPSSVTELAREFDLHAGALERLLNACVGLGLLAKHGDSYANTAESDVYLRSGSPESLAGYVLYSDQALYPMWGHLAEALKEGTSRWRQTFGWEGAIFDHFFHTPEARKSFLDGMHGFGRLSSPEVVRVFNLNQFRRLVDLGGGTGHLAIAACERYGGLHGTVYDLPQVIGHARPHLEASSAAARLDAVAGNFFSDPLPEADLYTLGKILHDWQDAKVESLLRKIQAALPAGGAVLIAETLLDEDGSGPVAAQLQSLNMLICTEGRERTASEYRRLLEACGFDRVEARRTGSPLDAVLAFKKQ